MTGLLTLKERRTQLSLKFAKNCVKTGKGADLFPLNPKTVNTRQHEKYFVTPAHTDRLETSIKLLYLSEQFP